MCVGDRLRAFWRPGSFENGGIQDSARPLSWWGNNNYYHVARECVVGIQTLLESGEPTVVTNWLGFVAEADYFADPIA